jgi:Tn3 transposase DDE domain
MRIAIFFGALTVGLFFAIELAAGHYGPQVGKRFLERSTNYSAESLRDWVTAAPASARSYAFLVLFPLDLMFMLALGGFLGYGSLSSAESVDALRKPDPALRQRSHAGLNKGEASNALRRAVFFHRQGAGRLAFPQRAQRFWRGRQPCLSLAPP